ncbi:MAG: hypothetical protein R3C56_31315 [Pirellulaceae bacterium]
MTLWEIDILPAPGESDVAGINLASEARDLGLSPQLSIAARTASCCKVSSAKSKYNTPPRNSWPMP